MVADHNDLRPSSGKNVAREARAAEAQVSPGTMGRAEVVERYREWILTKPELLARLPELRGRVLACWCGHDEDCHADVLIELVDAEETIEKLLAVGVQPEIHEDGLRLRGASKAAPELVERARRHKAAILSLLAARRSPAPPDASDVWLNALDRLQAEIDVPPDVLAELKAARVKFA
ncbi:MAG: DUF4326 domain-containing protein [Planctomycetota bacterium]|nr:MAG: DUF4326 domain-containing protein [Planctomycetota bacterium]